MNFKEYLAEATGPMFPSLINMEYDRFMKKHKNALKSPLVNEFIKK